MKTDLFASAVLAAFLAIPLVGIPLAVSTLDRVSKESADASAVECLRYLRTGKGPLLVRDLQAAPSPLADATWQAWGERVSEMGADEDDIAAADARLSEFIAGHRSHVNEEDLEIGSPAIVAAAHAKLD